MAEMPVATRTFHILLEPAYTRKMTVGVCDRAWATPRMALNPDLVVMDYQRDEGRLILWRGIRKGRRL